MSKKCIVLISNMANGLNLTAQKNMVDKLVGQKVDFTQVEAVEQVEKRNELFEISGKKGLFPQMFFEEDGKITFFGGAEEFNDLFETDSLPKEVLDQNPDLPTFSRVFTGVPRK